MKILHITKFYHDGARAGGVGRHVLQLHNLLEEQGHEVLPFGMLDNETPDWKTKNYFVSETKLDGSGTWLEKIKAVGRMFWSVEAAEKLNALIDETRPDVAHIHNIYHHLSPSVLSVLRRRGIPIVQTAHDFKRIRAGYALYPTGDPIPDGVKRPWLHRFILGIEFLYVRLFRFYERLVDLTITPSTFVKKEFVKAGQNAERLHVMSHPRPFEPLSDTPNFEERQGLLYVGRLSEEKGLLVLLDAISKMRERPTVTILGDGPQRREVEAFIREHELEADVTMMGHTSKEQVGGHMLKARALVMPSLCCETFGMTVIEAAAHGLPAVVSNRGALPELVDDNRGWKMEIRNPQDIANSLQKIEEKTAWEERQKNGIEWIKKEQFSPSRYVSELIRLYDQIV